MENRRSPRIRTGTQERSPRTPDIRAKDTKRIEDPIRTKRSGITTMFAIMAMGLKMLKYKDTRGKTPNHAAVETVRDFEIKKRIFPGSVSLSISLTLNTSSSFGLTIMMERTDANDNWKPASKSWLGFHRSIARAARLKEFRV